MKEKIVMSDKEFWLKQRIEKATKEEIINYYRKKLKILSMICVICILGIYLFGIFSLFNQAKNYAEIILILGETGVIPKTFAEDNKDMAKFRNLVAHDYDKITPEGIHANLQKAPDIFRRFAKYFVGFMEKRAKED